MWRPASLPLPIIVPILLAGCSLRLPPPAATSYDAATAPRPSPCAHAGKPIPLPAAFPSQFPLPAGTAITVKATLPGEISAVEGFISARNEAGTVKFFEDYLPLAGFAVQRLAPTGVGMTSELFRGHDHTGIWSISRVPGCSRELEFSVQTVRGTGNGPPVDPD